MIDTKLLLLEGMPGPGKSTNSRFLTIQLDRHDNSALWSHEELRLHATLFFMKRA